MRTFQIFIFVAGMIIACNSCNQSSSTLSREFDPEIEKPIVSQVIHNAICWAMTKDTATLYSTFIPDSTLFIFSPDSASTQIGFQTIREAAENIWMSDRFKAVECNVRGLRIQFSRNGDVAWYSCYLDDISQWDGQLVGWRNVRWTGVLEKIDGQWLIMQMHFSYPMERFL